MPKVYEKIRDSLAQGAQKDSPAYNQAQSRAVALYVSKGKSAKARSQRAKALKAK